MIISKTFCRLLYLPWNAKIPGFAARLHNSHLTSKSLSKSFKYLPITGNIEGPEKTAKVKFFLFFTLSPLLN